MRYLADGIEMKKVDSSTIEEIGIPSVVLMERAALSVVEELEDRIVSPLHILCICGMGNNGADGMAAARILTEHGWNAEVYFPVSSAHVTDEWRLQRKVIENLGIREVNSPSFDEYTVLVDALFGVGLTRSIEGSCKECIERMNASKTPVLSVDIPSGIDSSGKVLGTAVRAAWTVCLGLKKLGCAFYPGAEYAGEVIVRNIGFPKQVFDKVRPRVRSLEREDLKKIPRREAYGNKGTFGKILVIAGSVNMAGAAYLSASAAIAAGAGLVRIFTCAENREILQKLLPTAVLTVYRSEERAKVLADALEWADCIVIGPGLGKEEDALKTVRQTAQYCRQHKEKSCIADADALNIISMERELLDCFRGSSIFTPHLGEMSRLSGSSIKEIQEDLLKTAESFAAEHGIVMVLKDARTVIAGSDENGKSERIELFLNESGNSGMATGGSGDVLTGIIAGFCVMKDMTLLRAAVFGAYFHGVSGDAIQRKKGSFAMEAEDILTGMVEIFLSLKNYLE